MFLKLFCWLVLVLPYGLFYDLVLNPSFVLVYPVN